MTKPKLHSCKIGTQPGLVVLKGGYKPMVGREVMFRRHNGNVGVWERGIVDKINPDGYFFINLM